MLLMAVPVAVLAAAVAVGAMRWIPYHPSREEFPVRGLDVSRHQGAIDWTALAAGEADFVYIKATEGGDWVDPQFARNWRDAQSAGVPRGAYHFFTLCRSGVEQAAHFIATVPREEDMLPPAVDLEYGGNCGEGPRRLDAGRELAAFLDLVEPHYGRAAVLYATAEFYKEHLIGDERDNPLWLRSLIIEPRYNERAWTIWQYSAFGRSPGVRGPVDWNAFTGTPSDFDAWRRPPG
jgi:lysozyme